MYVQCFSINVINMLYELFFLQTIKTFIKTYVLLIRGSLMLCLSEFYAESILIKLRGGNYRIIRCDLYVFLIR